MLGWIEYKNQTQNKRTVNVMKAMLLTVFCIGFFVIVNPVFAQEFTTSSNQVLEGLEMIEEPLGLPAFDIRIIIANIIKVALSLVGTVMVVLIMYGGYLYMTAGGNEDQVAKAKSILKNAVIGLAIILSAYSITLFVMKMLGYESQPMMGPGSQVYTQNFAGSGALGRIIKDHYPERDQLDVPRNTKILVTFRNPILLDGIVDDKNGNDNGILGDCINVGTEDFDWERDCDKLILDDDKINITPTGDNAASEYNLTGASLVAATTTMSNGITGIYTIVIRPFDYLGDDIEDVSYKVRLGEDMKADDPELGDPPIFSVATNGNKYYEWQFTCGTELDLSPPHVSGVWPDKDDVSPRNTVIQIDFSEPINPLGIQGNFVTTTMVGESYYWLGANSNLYLKNGDNLEPVGVWNLVNAYRTLEFTPTLKCGENACGNPIYCLPNGGDEENSLNTYQILLQSAQTIEAGSWESFPFSGVADLCDNALDGNNDNIIQTAINSFTVAVFNNWFEPDNFWWNFDINNKIDSTAPFIEKITPGLDAQNIILWHPLQISFSKRMRIEPLYSIDIIEYPEDDNGVPIYKRPKVVLGNKSLVHIDHGPFLDGRRQYYFPAIDSRVEGVNFNCFYPGVGPGGDYVDADGTHFTSQGSSHLDVSLICGEDGSNCSPATSTLGIDFSCDGAVITGIATTTACVDFLEINSVTDADLE